ncbi:MAG: hypothetical protein HUU38_14580, partial [Anaerolineales bacterium]|nr:hypothetical protein [Anaerolineales bacterium]
MKPNTDPVSPARTKRVQQSLLLTLFFLASGAFLLFALEGPMQRTELISVSLQTDRLADYSIDPLTTPLPVISLALIEDFLRDQNPQATGVIERVATAQAGLLTPIPTVTPRPGEGEPPPVATPTPTATVPPAPENTPELTPTATPTPGPSSTPSPTPTLTPTSTLPFAATVTLTPTSAPNDPTATSL